MTTAGIKYKKTSRQDQFKIYELLKKHGKVEGEFYRYNDGWTDAEILKTIGGSASIWAVKDIRQGSFGKLQPASGGNGLKPLLPRIIDLEELYLKISERLDKLESKEKGFF